MMGGTGPADAATDTFVRNLAAEVGPHGVRVVGLWTAGVPETLSPEKLASVDRDLDLSTGILNMPPGVLEGLQLVVSDIEAARAELVERGVEASPVQHMDGGVWVEGRGGDWNSFVFFSDPDGNGWVLQERPARD